MTNKKLSATDICKSHLAWDIVAGNRISLFVCNCFRDFHCQFHSIFGLFNLWSDRLSIHNVYVCSIVMQKKVKIKWLSMRIIFNAEPFPSRQNIYADPFVCVFGFFPAKPLEMTVTHPNCHCDKPLKYFAKRNIVPILPFFSLPTPVLFLCLFKRTFFSA